MNLWGRVRRILNPVMRLWAPYLSPLTLVRHAGRRSGRHYATPVLAWRQGDRLAVVLFYGEHTDWVRNVLAAGAAEVRRAGHTWLLTNPRVVDATDPAVVVTTVRRLAGSRWRVLLGELSD